MVIELGKAHPPDVVAGVEVGICDVVARFRTRGAAVWHPRGRPGASRQGG